MHLFVLLVSMRYEVFDGTVHPKQMNIFNLLTQKKRNFLIRNRKDLDGAMDSLQTEFGKALFQLENDPRRCMEKTEGNPVIGCRSNLERDTLSEVRTIFFWMKLFKFWKMLLLFSKMNTLKLF
ncbi:hypothetical protein AVEN_247140-1 [Araneus ventricosus]|uniref:Uncharacterized protein n=1 Tax=Araneus ventricosus TaxID=182803 RepID=A0A4Y2UPW8_ARAVE|nr:hypothetical protein AVEN_247140-1 [Araneus ventricosus]